MHDVCALVQGDPNVDASIEGHMEVSDVYMCTEIVFEIANWKLIVIGLGRV